jgi:hypothetical protein
MFEKEAKISFDELDDRGVGDDWSIEESYENGFSNGAEFAYNKANEWHNIKENPNDLPNDGELVVADNGLAIDCVKFIKNEFGNSWQHDKFVLCDVICWKKLILSKDRNK